MSVLDFMEEKKTTRKKKVKDEEVPMDTFTCVTCKGKFFDMGSYFHNKPSTKCIWCSKYPNRLKEKKK